jgi:hypothetical protein
MAGRNIQALDWATSRIGGAGAAQGPGFGYTAAAGFSAATAAIKRSSTKGRYMSLSRLDESYRDQLELVHREN